MFTRIGGHSVNPINVFAVEAADIEVNTTTKASNGKEVVKTEMVPGVLITGLGGAVEVEGVTVDQVEEELNRAMVAVYLPPQERES